MTKKKAPTNKAKTAFDKASPKKPTTKKTTAAADKKKKPVKTKKIQPVEPAVRKVVGGCSTMQLNRANRRLRF